MPKAPKRQQVLQDKRQQSTSMLSKNFYASNGYTKLQGGRTFKTSKASKNTTTAKKDSENTMRGNLVKMPRIPTSIGPSKPMQTSGDKERGEGRPYILSQGAFHPFNFIYGFYVK